MLKNKYEDKKIANIVVNYSNEQEVIKYAHELSKQSFGKYLVLIIVINKSTDEDIAFLKREIDCIDIAYEIFNPKENLGYLSGAFYGYREFSRSFMNLIDWVIISNTDIMINNKSFIEVFLSKSYLADIYSISPSVYQLSTKSYENPHYLNKISKFKLDFLIFIFSNIILSFVYLQFNHIKSIFKKVKKPESTMMYQGHGCFFILRKGFVDSISLENYPGFMYSEESYISEFLLQDNKKWFYDSDLEIVHEESTVTNLLNMNQKSKFYKDSLIYIRKRFY